MRVEKLYCPPAACTKESEAPREKREQQIELGAHLFSDIPDGRRCWEAFFTAADQGLDSANKIITEADNDTLFAWELERPPHFRDLLNQIFLMQIKHDALSLSTLGFHENLSLKAHTGSLFSCSIDERKRQVVLANHYLMVLSDYNPVQLTDEDSLSYQIIVHRLKHIAKGEAFILHDYLISPLVGIMERLNRVLLDYHRFDSIEDCKLYQKRLEKVAVLAEEIKLFLQKQNEKGIKAPGSCLADFIGQLHSLIDGEDPYLHNMLKKFPDAKEIEWGENPAIAAFADLLAFCEEMRSGKSLESLRDDSHNHGVHALPDGKEFYHYCLKEHTSVELTAEEIHQTGLDEVEKISTEMRALLQEVGIENNEASVGALMQELSDDKKHFFSNDTRGKDACLHYFEELIKRSYNELGHLFSDVPQESVAIKPVPAHLEDSFPGACYWAPSLDGRREGTFYVNLRNTNELPKFGCPTLAVHEAVPGHHFQLTIQCRSSLPLMRRTPMKSLLSEEAYDTAYAEGWALYTEKLALEEGFYKTPLEKLGHYQDELLRAARLVVDTGIHHYGWPRSKAIAYMIETLGYERSVVETEVDRYLSWPGQACAYKIGQLKLLEMRDNAKKLLGDQFSYPEFHQCILNAASMPLAILEKHVDQYIYTKLLLPNA